jgi:hypothetical protein
MHWQILVLASEGRAGGRPFLNQSTLKKEQEGVTGRITTEEFTSAFQQWYECCQKCLRLAAVMLRKVEK